MFVLILLTQVHDHSTHHFSNIFNESFKFFWSLLKWKEKNVGKKILGKKSPFLILVKWYYFTLFMFFECS